MKRTAYYQLFDTILFHTRCVTPMPWSASGSGPHTVTCVAMTTIETTDVRTRRPHQPNQRQLQRLQLQQQQQQILQQLVQQLQ